MDKPVQDEARQAHIDGFIDSFLIPIRSDRFRALLLNPKRRCEVTDDLNHKLSGYLISDYIVAVPPTLPQDATAYIVSDERKIDDSFVDAAAAVELLKDAYFGTLASFIPGSLVAFKGEAPSKLIWLHRTDCA